MIPAPKGWSIEELGGELTLVHPAGRAQGVIRYRERVRPLRTLPELVAADLLADVALQVETVGNPHLLVTVEGEYGALVTVTGRRGGQPVQRDLGYVICDDSFARVDGIAVAGGGGLTAMVRHLVRHDVQLLGVRRRRVLFDPPAGWEEREVGFRSEWVSPAFPDDPAAIAVWPAMPVEGPAAAGVPGLIARHAGGARVHGPARVDTTRGLSGARWTIESAFADGSPLSREVVVLQDDRYAYVVRLDATPKGSEAHRAVLEAVVASVQPVPRPRPPREPTAAIAAMDHWLA